MMDLKSDMRAAYRRAYEETPGLERFDRSRKWLLCGVFGIAALQKLLLIPMLSASPVLLLISAMIGLCLPGIIVLAIHRGQWSCSLVLYALGAYILYDLLKSGLPALASGVVYIPLFYVLMALEAVYMVYLLALAVWLTVPASNRAYAQILNGIFKESGQR